MPGSTFSGSFSQTMAATPECSSSGMNEWPSTAVFSRGMLGNSSDFKGEGTPDATPTLYATAERSRQSKVRSRLDIKGKKRTLSHPDAVKAGVPDVRGYGLRDAINALERAGYRVSFSGAGYVAGQNPSPGTRIGRGNKVMLHLTE